MSSIKMAVPLMIILALVVAAGTLVESKYNTDLARLIFYDSTWFAILMCLLWLNILFATLSRYPYQKKHVGFVITHIGLLTLLIGSLVTSVWGLDGQLAIEENSSNNQVVLPGLELHRMSDDAIKTVPVTKRMFAKKFSENEWGLQQFLPFAEAKEDFVLSENKDAGVVVGFLLKSSFFNVGEALHSEIRPEMNLGPARLKLIVGQQKPNAKKAQSFLIVKSAETQKIIKEIPIDEMQKRSIVIEGAQIKLKNIFEQALVGGKDKGIRDGGAIAANPAIELEISKDKKVLRELSFSQHPEFTLNANGAHGLSFEYVYGERTGNNLIEFYFDPKNKEQVKVVLSKNGGVVMSEVAKSGSSIQTPWMGMTITVGSIIPQAEVKNDVVKAELKERQPLPPTAIELNPPDVRQTFWLLENEQRDFLVEGKRISYAYGRKQHQLPFSLYLQKFTKKDYLGTQTPMWYSSDVNIDDNKELHTISMNEPLSHMGYTIYQSSFQQGEGLPTVSIFSVNRDPGRPIKYAGSLILSLGIIIFTLMRSRFYKKPQEQK